VRVETLYHQRLRPALEYTDLAGLVRLSTALEDAYGYPLDVEFAVEGHRLWILQVRPVAAALSVLPGNAETNP
jgi:pyruvate,water dikinase